MSRICCLSINALFCFIFNLLGNPKGIFLEALRDYQGHVEQKISELLSSMHNSSILILFTVIMLIKKCFYIENCK